MRGWKSPFVCRREKTGLAASRGSNYRRAISARPRSVVISRRINAGVRCARSPLSRFSNNTMANNHRRRCGAGNGDRTRARVCPPGRVIYEIISVKWNLIERGGEAKREGPSMLPAPSRDRDRDRDRGGEGGGGRKGLTANLDRAAADSQRF